MNPLLQYVSPVLSDAGLVTADVAAMMAFMGIFLIIYVIFVILYYIYGSLTMMLTAKKLKTEPSWLAWIPVVNGFLLAKMAKRASWPVWLEIAAIPFMVIGIAGIYMKNTWMIIAGFLVMFPFILTYSVFGYIWMYKICEARNRPGWWALIPLVSLVGIPFTITPIIGAIITNLISFAVGTWSLVMWGILAWGK